ncbi:MAG: capsule assembly Wzi family protein [Bacteroidota bacterium]
MKTIFIKISAAIIICLSYSTVHSQSLPVGTPVLDDYYRRLQLLGKIDSTISFAIRPIYPIISTKIADVYDPDSTLKANTGTITFAKGAGKFMILPLTWQQQFNSDHPYGWNDGLMIPAKGYQTLISGGFFTQIGPLSIQFRPEYVYAVNPVFEGFASGHNDQDLASYYGYHNFIDAPERFGNGPYHKASLGQSSIRLTFGPVSMGLSNENIWWGPGIRNSLLLTNNAPGFKHVTINTVRPINTIIGSFEGQIIGARLNNSNLSPLNVTTTSTGNNIYIVKPDEWRYYSGFNFNYQPKWVPGLFIGLTRAFDAYHSDVKGFSGYMPLFTGYQKFNTIGDAFPRDQVTSFYARWLFTHAKAEIYFDYGLNDNSYNWADFIGSPEHSRAYVFGIRKFIDLPNKKGQGILFSTEITQLSQSPDRLVRDAGGWYIHSQVTQGMTNEGQVIGAGTGSGGNLQSFDVSWVNGLKKIGFQFERYEHDVDFMQANLPPINGNSRNWVDLGFALLGDWEYKNLLFNAKLEGIKSLNYEWVLKNHDPSLYYIPNNSVFNLHAELGITYRF